jgi:hypothetical protein
MKGKEQYKGTKGNRIVESIVNDYWMSDYQKIPQEDDDAVDGIIHIRKHGELTGEVIYVQIKHGDSHGYITKKRPDYVSVRLGKEYLEKHKPRWMSLTGAVILVFIEDIGKAYWTNLKDEDSYPKDCESIVLIPKRQRFGQHSKGDFRKCANVFPQDNNLLTIKMERSELSYLRIDTPIKDSARQFYKEWSHSSIDDKMNPSLGEIIVNRSGWRHISRSSRGYDKIFQSWQLLSVAKKWC